MLLPALLPLTFHWYAGFEPPLEGVAVKVAEDPEHTGLADDVILTLTGKTWLTVMVILLDVSE